MRIRSAAILALCTTAFTLTLFAAAPADGDLTHDVAIHLGKTTLLPGDSITIDAIHGTADAVTTDNTYRVDGHYALATHEKANLSISVTSSVDGHNDSHAPGLPESIEVEKGSGEFHLYFHLPVDGDAHMSFYPVPSGSSFASVYFNGTHNWSQADASQPITDAVK